MTNEANPTRTHGRALLWVALVISAVANAATSVAGLNLYISISFGVLTLFFGAALLLGRRERR
ncbi:hypothetical protein [Lentzea sp. E54]|uniref:hypothetical protein n=1 Tax=Lentzea xerophila TaxID=3435883 RepID=UPI003DA4D1E7